jgi:hypothetical protein
VSPYFHKFFAFTIALATAGAQVVCACPTPVVFHQVSAPITKACAGQSDCCRKAEASKPVEPAKQEPCEKCNLKHRTQQAMPDRQAGSAVPQLALSFIPAPVAILTFTDISSARPQMLEAFPLPPLLKDLFHVHSLLLN